MAKYGILINYKYCNGCRSCELACKQEHSRPPDEWGLKVIEVDPHVTGKRKYYFPFPTSNCNLCGKRIARGKQPACVHHCRVKAMKFGKIEDLTEAIANEKESVLWSPH